MLWGRTDRKPPVSNKGRFRRGLVYSSTMNVDISADANLTKYDELTKSKTDESLKIEFTDMTANNLINLPEKVLEKLKQPGLMQPEDFRRYPLLSINRINFGPGDNSKCWIFTGSQSGLCRLIRLSHFDK